jgi:hypothetical protein
MSSTFSLFFSSGILDKPECQYIIQSTFYRGGGVLSIVNLLSIYYVTKYKTMVYTGLSDK